jgi:hypothetical protein
MYYVYDIVRVKEIILKKLGENSPVRLQLLIDEGELEVIDAYQHDMRINGRSAAIRELVRIALKAEEGAGNWKPKKTT